jgi:hypothetical protein
MKRIKVHGFPAALATVLLLVSADIGAQQAQLPRFEGSVTVPGTSIAGSTGDHLLAFSAPFALPGVSLPAGRYIFRNPSKEGHVLQVMSADRQNVYVTLLTTPTTRTRSTRDYGVKWESNGDAPQRLKAWFAPNSYRGEELAYPAAAPSAPQIALR